MEPNQYKVDVLHYINPHLIWVLVRKDGDVNSFYFEQIGIYGILPQNVTFGEDCVVKSEPCQQWMPAASVAMRRCFLEADYVMFSPTYIDEKRKKVENINTEVTSNASSIFDNSTHKYGHLIVVKKNGEKVNVLREIVNSEFAYEDECLFHQELSSNNLNTQLNYITTHQIMSKIEEAHKTRDIPKKTWLSILRQQASVHQEQKHLESSIMSRRLEAQDRGNVDKLLQNKMNALKLCKDVDEVSVGRACGTRNSSTSNQSSVVSVANRKLQWLESQSIDNQPKEAHKLVADDSGILPKSASMHAADDKTQHIHSDMKNNNDDEQNNNAVSPKSKNHNKQDNNAKIGKVMKSRKTAETHTIAFGPAGLSASKFTIKPQITREEKEEPVIQEKKPEPESEYQEKKNEDVYANTDSEVNLKISNLHLLKRIKANNNIQNNSVTNKHRNKDEALSALKYRIKYIEEKHSKINDSLSSSLSDKDRSKCDLDSDVESITGLEEKLGLRINNIKKDDNPEVQTDTFDVKRCNVNPFKNVDGTISIFVDKLVSPVLMVHCKKDNRIEPVSNMRDIPFGNDILVVLRNMGVEKPMRPQTVSWPTILRGHSFFLIGPKCSGNTMGYLPAVCRLVYDFKNTPDKFGLSCIIVCATSHAVTSVQAHCEMFLHSAKIFACYAGFSDMDITTALLNGCDLLICTPSMLVRLIQGNLGLDIRNLSTFVIDDCEHISTTYDTELKFCLLKVMDMVKNRAHKEWKVQYIIVSRVWCDFMSSLARKAPDSVVCISAFQECVLYSKAATSVEFVVQENKLTSVINFLQGIDKSKKTVIVCKADEEVKLVEKALTKLGHIVFSCDNTMTVQDLYNLDKTLKEYEEPLLGPILVCCDGNLTHLNVTDAQYLVHYSLPHLFSMFCKRFAVLIDNYASIFKSNETNIKIKILIDDDNIQQLPKILNFIKRCTTDVPPFLDEICSSVKNEKDLMKAQNLVPICTRLLTLGKCPDYWNCAERHTIFKEFDSPKPWLPKEGIITFRILHYHSAVNYSARISSCSIKSNITKYPQTYSLLSIKMGIYYSKEANRKLHGEPKVGDMCAVTQKQNLFVRCQVTKKLKAEKGKPIYFVIKLIDEEIYETAQDISLYYLPDDFKNIETHVVTVFLANLMPHDKDVTFSKLALDQLKQITDENDELYMRGQITMVVGNTIFVDTLEACQDLSSLEEVVVKSDFRKELLDRHAIPHPDHIDNLRKVCDYEREIPKEIAEPIAVANPVKALPKGRWAHLDSGGFSSVFFMYAENPSQFFVRPIKFEKCMIMLIQDIIKYVNENPEPIESVNVGDIVLAEFPDDNTCERARIDSNVNNDKVKCFFVDQGEWRDVSIKKIYPITEKFITQLPFQAIECRLVGIQPLGDNWTDFSTNFFVDSCFDSVDKHKQLFTKYFTKEKAEFTEGHKYGVVLIDTYSSEDIIINQMMVDRNLAEENDEIKFLDDLGFERKSEESSDSDVDDEPIKTVNKIDRSLLVDDKNKEKQYIPSNKPNCSSDSENSFDESNFELMGDESGKIFSIPIAQVVSITELPDAEWSEQVLASPIETSESPSKENPKPKVTAEEDKVSRPQVQWRQNKNNVTIKIKLIAEDYDLIIKERYMKFTAEVNNINYGFDFELYGVVDLKKCFHYNKGQYILVKLWKIMATNWLTLTRHNELMKWIVYDIDSIDVSSDEESEIIDHSKNFIKNYADSDSDDNLQDDVGSFY